MRVASLVCSNTEIVCALGCGGQLVAVDDHSDFPDEVVRDLIRLGPDLDIRIEGLRAVRPDLVLASSTVPGHEKVLERLAAEGIPHVTLAPTSLEETFGSIATVADLLGVPERGRVLLAASRLALEPRQPPPRRPNILVEWWPRPVYAPGRRSWVTDLLERAGGNNPFAVEDRESLTVEADDPPPGRDAVVVSWCGVPFHRYRTQVVLEREGWSHVPALRRGAVHCVPEAWLGRPGPRLVLGYQALCALVSELAAEEAA